MTATILAACLVLISLVLLLVSEFVCPARRIWFKALASTGFLAIALFSNPFDSRYGLLVLGALVLCWFGDVLLSMPKRFFVPGLAAFLCAHLFLIASFLIFGVSLRWIGLALLGIVPISVVTLVWLRPRVPRTLMIPVVAYVAIIGLMVVTALGAFGEGLNLIVAIGAVCFYASDFFVARNQFVTEGPTNALVCLPLYYFAVSAFAYSVALH